MMSSKMSISYRGQQIIVAAATILILTSTIVESLIAPFSPSCHQRNQMISSVDSLASQRTPRVKPSNSVSSVQLPVSRRTSTAASTVLFATSLGDTQMSSSELEEEDVGKKEADDIQNELSSSVSKFRQLKDVMWIRETLEDWTAAEFALSVERQSEGASNANGKGDDGNLSSLAAASNSSRKETKKRAVDYEKLLSQITKRIEDMTCQPFVEDSDLVDEKGMLQMDEKSGMGRYAYTNEERMMLMEYVETST